MLKLQLTENDYKILFRDLSKDECFDIRTILENKQQQQQTESKKKNKKLTKKEIILQKNKERKTKKLFTQDEKNISNITIPAINMFEMKNKFKIMKTEKGVLNMKMKFLQKAFIEKDMENTIDLYIELKNHYDIFQKKQKKLLDKIKKKCKKLNSLEFYQLNNLGNRLPPLDFYNNHTFTLEPWQKKVVHLINNKKSAFLSIPTGGGKSILMTYLATLNYNVLILLPTEALALQTVAHFHKIKSHTCGILTDNYNYNFKEASIKISTFHSIYENIEKVGYEFDYIVYDEIHTIQDYYYKEVLQNLISYFKGSILALSATIKNIESLKKWWESVIDNPIEIVNYRNRFINLQRHKIFKNNIINLHPCSLINLQDLENNNIDNISFCPQDLAECWATLKRIFKNSDVIQELNPEIYFKTFDTYRITLGQTKKYEKSIKQKLVELTKSHKNEIIEFLDIFNESSKDDIDINLTKIFYDLKTQKMLPGLIFLSDQSYLMTEFRKCIEKMENILESEWPFYMEHQEYRTNLFEKLQLSKQKIEKFRENEKNSKSKNKKNVGSVDREAIDFKYMELIKNEEEKHLDLLIAFYEKEKEKIIKNDNSIIFKNFERYYEDIYEWKTVPYTTIYDRPEDLCFNVIKFDQDDFNIMKKTLIKSGFYIDSKNIYIRGLVYGLGIYIKELPSCYLNLVQLYSNDRKLGLIFSDDTLSMGINMPIKSVSLCKINDKCFNKNDIIQKMGRAGRRNKDTSGHVIFINKGDLTTNIINEKPKNNNLLLATVSYISCNVNKLAISKTDEFIQSDKFITKLRKLLSLEYSDLLFLWKSVKNFQMALLCISILKILKNDKYDINLNTDLYLMNLLWSCYTGEILKCSRLKQNILDKIFQEAKLKIKTIYPDIDNFKNEDLKQLYVVVMNLLSNRKINITIYENRCVQIFLVEFCKTISKILNVKYISKTSIGFGFEKLKKKLIDLRIFLMKFKV